MPQRIPLSTRKRKEKLLGILFEIGGRECCVDVAPHNTMTGIGGCRSKLITSTLRCCLMFAGWIRWLSLVRASRLERHSACLP